jgi:hypothetical protein
LLFVRTIMNTLLYYIYKNAKNLVLAVMVQLGLKDLMKFCYELHSLLLIVKLRLMRCIQRLLSSKPSLFGVSNKKITNMTLHSTDKSVYTSTLTIAFLIHRESPFSVEETSIL